MNAPLNLREYEAPARERLSPAIYDWFTGGAADEITLRENESAWSRLRLRPRVLVDVNACDASTTILGREVTMPVMTAPCAQNGLMHPEGEIAVARAAGKAGLIQVLSTGSTFSLEEVAAVAGPGWFQMYCFRDQGINRSLAERAEQSGYAALCVTVDAPSDGLRERDARNRFRFPPGTRLGNLGHLTKEEESFADLSRYDPDAAVSWDTIDWLRGLTGLPLVLKGILSPDDARLAVEHGVVGVVVSNHGGRQLDTSLTGCEALPAVVDAVAGRAEVYVDGGIRRGTDIVKAIALGARAVLIGRPYVWGLTVAGEAGVSQVLEHLRKELKLSMAMCGCPSVDRIGPELISSTQFPR